MFPSRTRLRVSLALAIVLIIGLFQTVPLTKKSALAPRSEDPLTVADVFSFIYQSQIWGESTADAPFFSGRGSHDEEVVHPYVSAARSFIAETFSTPPNAVDLGCGDFNVGRQIRNATDRYVACDVVPGVIEHNRIAYAGDEVDFRVLDLISEELPEGDVVLIRQVLQHLRNDQISRFLPKLRRYKWAIITEHLPLNDPFTPNLDIITGSVRVEADSGVELTMEPFNLAHYNSRVLCESLAKDGRIRTTAYQLQKPL